MKNATNVLSVLFLVLSVGFVYAGWEYAGYGTCVVGGTQSNSPATWEVISGENLIKKTFEIVYSDDSVAAGEMDCYLMADQDEVKKVTRVEIYTYNNAQIGASVGAIEFPVMGRVVCRAGCR